MKKLRFTPEHVRIKDSLMFSPEGWRHKIMKSKI